MTGLQPDIGWYAFVHDFIDGGIETVADELAESGSAHVNVAFLYHVARDVLPRNPRRRLRYMPTGAHYFQPESERYGRILPFVDPELDTSDPIRAIGDELSSRAMRLNAWMVFLHDNPRAMSDPTMAQRNVFGDRMLTDLCPANPDVIDFASAVAGDAARYRPAAILAESLHFHPLQHGYHHERYLFTLGTLANFALSLCFCDSCISRAASRDVDVERIQRWATQVATAAFDGNRIANDFELTRERAAELAGGQMAGYLGMREDVVADIVARVAATLEGSETDLILIDPSGGVKGWATGEPQGAAVIETGWQFGIDAVRLAGVVDDIEVLAYTRDVDRLDSDLYQYREALGQGARVRVSMRPVMPDTVDSAHLSQKLKIAQSHDVSAIDFYHYGLVPQPAVDLVRAALAPRGGWRT
jgi:hypothetical protein